MVDSAVEFGSHHLLGLAWPRVPRDDAKLSGGETFPSLLVRGTILRGF